MTSDYFKQCVLGLLFASALGTAQGSLNTLDVEFSGCASVLKDGKCLLPKDSAIQLWINSTKQPIRVYADAQLLTPLMTKIVQGGVLQQITVPENTRSLKVISNNNTWSLFVDRQSPPHVFSEADALVREGKPEQARRAIEEALPTIPIDWHGVALKTIGQAQRLEGNTNAAMRSLEAAIAADMRAGRSSDALRSTTVLSFILLENGREFDRARNLLNAMLPLVKGDAESHYYLDYFLGLINYNAGNARGALRHLSQAAEQATRIGNNALRSYAESVLAVQLQQIGRYDLARELLATWVEGLPDDMKPCDRASHLNNLAWAELLILEAGETTDDPTNKVLEAYELKRQHCPANDRMNVLTNLALARLHAGDATQASQYVALARAESSSPRMRPVLWLLDIEARALLAQGDLSGALSVFLDLQKIANATLSPTARWRAAVGKARVHNAMGNAVAALESFAVADLILEEGIFSVPLDAGRETLLTARNVATREHIALLLDEGREQQAFELARRARSRVLRSLNISERISALNAPARARWEYALARYQKLRSELDEQSGSAWMLAADELAQLERVNLKRQINMREIVDDAVNALNAVHTAPYQQPARGELFVTFYPLSEGWAVFSHNGIQLEVFRPGCSTEKNIALAACLILPLKKSLAHASVLRVLPVGSLKNVDFHALPVGDQQLIDILPVVYGIDIASRRGSIPVRGRALLVADAHGDLAAARDELNVVQATLDASAGWQSERVTGAAASASAVLNKLDGAELFHFAGHARYMGELGWDSELKLADSSSIDVTDIITLKNAPQLVVLSGCETARTAALVQPESVGLANAFLVAGSKSVIATSRLVRDDVAKKVVDVFYQKWTAGEKPHDALRAAQLILRDSQPDADWAAYRIIER